MNTPRRTIRIDDARWAALDAKAAEEGTDKSELIKRAIDALLGWPVAALCVAVALLGLSACGGTADAGSEPQVSVPAATSTAASDAEASAIVSQQAEAQASASAAAEDALTRAIKGECVSLTYNLEPGKLVSERGQALRDAFTAWQYVTDPAQVVSDGQAVLAMIPTDSEGCDDGDRNLFHAYRDTIEMTIAQAS